VPSQAAAKVRPNNAALPHPSSSVGLTRTPDPQVERVHTDTAFLSPTGNIRCAVTRQLAGCDLDQRDWKLPPAPKDCQGNDDPGDIGEGEWAMPILVATRGTGSFNCGTDVPLNLYDARRALPYGRGIGNSTFECVSERSGMTCRSTASGHGFTVSRAAYRVF
jgi:hypothetical protein